MPKLGVNIDHVATLRQARRGFYPDPVEAAQICEQAGADSIVAHLREDRRHIQDKDIIALRKVVQTRLNMELSLNQEIVALACRIKPNQATIVPERRQEITTEGGLDIIKYFQRTKDAVRKLQDRGIDVSLFIAPDKKQIDASQKTGAAIIEIHTGRYASAANKNIQHKEFKKIEEATRHAHQLGLEVNAGHGLNYENTKKIADIHHMHELNIGHAIIARAIWVGLPRAVKEMIAIARGRK